MANDQASNYLEKMLLDHIIGHTAYDLPSLCRIHLVSTVPDDTETNLSLVDLMNYTGYSGVTVSTAVTSTTFSSGLGVLKNTSVISFGENTGATSQMARGFVLTESTGATSKIQVWGALTNSLNVTPGVTPQFGIGDFVISCA